MVDEMNPHPMAVSFSSPGSLALGLVLLTGFVGTPGRAQETTKNLNTVPARLVPAKVLPERALSELKALELEKLASLQKLNRLEEACISRASNLEALHQCRREEHQAHRELRKSVGQRMAVISQRYGLPLAKPKHEYGGRKGEPQT
ncbi:hypothetical protein KBY58_07045 [Cyanobium sp. HWJ4-Hawea]|uniref:hypothetical protein n=1 Tax=Cyanobium sp. HWJ4-Hawea TaxID=2823713 RepID=UPI0020CD61F5|nr:hypothetical protein [Cyanobium sp. HWJ4-Hawea]MCP9809187.1 hypothetical protein [Cyanobium sp. HWJ4-Hawea]